LASGFSIGMQSVLDCEIYFWLVLGFLIELAAVYIGRDCVNKLDFYNP
jgi:hypothetical protein